MEEQPDDVHARRMLDELQSRYEEASTFYAAVERDLESLGVPEVLALLQEAIQIYPDHPAGRLVQARVRNRARTFHGHMQQGYEALRQGRWDIALDRLQQAHKLNRDAPRLAGAIEFVVRHLEHRRDLRGHIDQAIGRRDRRRALSIARELDLHLEEMRDAFSPA